MLPPSAAEVLEYHSHMAENDQRWWENRSFMKCHDQLISLKLPYLVGYGFDFKKCIARRQEKENNIRLKWFWVLCWRWCDNTLIRHISVKVANVSLLQKRGRRTKKINKFVLQQSTLAVSRFKVSYYCVHVLWFLQQPNKTGKYFYSCFPYWGWMMP